jgi:hypothetical protein
MKISTSASSLSVSKRCSRPTKIFPMPSSAACPRTSSGAADQRHPPASHHPGAAAAAAAARFGGGGTEFKVGREAAEGRVDDVQAARLQLLDHHLERAMATRSPGKLHCVSCSTYVCGVCGACRVVGRVVCGVCGVCGACRVVS